MSTEPQFENPHLLWTPQQLQARLGEENLVILDLRDTYQVMAGIIPGAAHLDLWGLGTTHTQPAVLEEWVILMRSKFGLCGVGQDSTVVVYEHDQTGMRAARAFWYLEYIGHPQVHVLDGGYAAWQAAGLETTREMVRPRPGRGLAIEAREDIYIGADELGSLLGEADLVLVDTRSSEEHTGQNKRGGPRGGTIPGAVHLEWTRLLDGRGCLKTAPELAALFQQFGILKDKRIVPF